MIDKIRVEPGHSPKLTERDPRETLGLGEKDEVKAELEDLVGKLEKLQGKLYAEARRSVLLVVQGLDASGKDGVVRAHVRDLDAVAELGAHGHGPLDQVVVEPPALGHEDERLAGRPLEASAVAEPEAHAIDDLLDDRVGRDGKLADGADRQAAAARLVARKARLVEEQHGRSLRGEAEGGRRPGRAGADDDDVEAFHPWIVVA